MLADLRVILRRLGESSLQQSQSAANQSLQSLGSFRRLLRSSSQLDGDDQATQAGSDELSTHLRERARESSDLLLAVVNAVERGQPASTQDKLIDELHGQVSAERDRVAALVDQVAAMELRLQDQLLERSSSREELSQVTTQRDKARAALRLAQAQVAAGATAVAAAAAGGGASEANSQAAAAAVAAAAAAAQLAAQSGGASAEELEELREAKDDAEKLAARRLVEIENMRRQFADLEATLNRERIDMSAALPDQTVERSELFQKLRQKQELTDALYREKLAEHERAQQALADAERQRVAELASIEQQHRAGVSLLTDKLRESEATLMRVRGERRAIGLRASELETEVTQLNDTKRDKDKYVEMLQAYLRALASRVTRLRARGDLSGVAQTAAVAGDAMLDAARARTDAETAVTSALDQVVAASQLEALQRELSDLRAQATLWKARQSNDAVDALRADLAAKLAAAEASAASAAEAQSVLEAEFGSMCEQFDSSTAQVEEDQKVIAAKEELNLKLMTDKHKTRVAIQTAKEAAMVKQSQIDKLEQVLNKQKAALDAKADELRTASEALEQRRQLIVELEAARDAAHAVELRRIEEDANVRARLDASAQRLAESKKLVDAHVVSVNELSAKVARVREEAAQYKRKWEAARAVNVGGQDEQVAYYREKLICNVCHDREKSTVISKCFHVFCAECVQQNLRDRHRKCPGCGIKFGEQDVHRLFLASAD